MLHTFNQGHNMDSPDATGLTVQLDALVAALERGDDSAREKLLLLAETRFRALARHMLKDYPGVHRWEQTDDVFQQAMLRSLKFNQRGLQRVPVGCILQVELSIDARRGFVVSLRRFAQRATQCNEKWLCLRQRKSSWYGFLRRSGDPPHLLQRAAPNECACRLYAG